MQQEVARRKFFQPLRFVSPPEPDLQGMAQRSTHRGFTLSISLEAYRKEHPEEGIGAIFRNLITGKEKQHMGDLLGIVNPLLDKQVPFDAEPIILGAPTFDRRRRPNVLENSPSSLIELAFPAPV